MKTARFVLTPFYECMDAIIPLTQLKITNTIPDVKQGRFIGNQMVEFSLQFDHSFLLSESKKHKSSKFDIRAIVRFCNIENVNKIDDQFTLKDSFPIHLKLNLNNTAITLPQFLPNDRSGKDGRRFPRPVDLSEGLLDNPLVINKFLMQWVQDDCKKETYYFAIYLVRRRTCEELTYILLKKQLSPIKNTLSFILEQSNFINNYQDDDLMLVNTTINISLNCPVSRVRMTTPVKGQHCNHLQCFDCITYLIMNFNKPSWQCPVCDKKTFFCYLEVDSLILGILNDPRSNGISNIIFNKNGQWKPDKKLPAVITEDESFNDIANYSMPTEATDFNKPAFQSIPENFAENHAEKYLQQILQTTSYSSFLARFRSPNSGNNMFHIFPNATVPNRLNHINHKFPEAHNRAPFPMGPNQPPNYFYNNPNGFQDTIRFPSSVSSNMTMNPGIDNVHPRFKGASKPLDPLSSFVTNHHQNHIHVQKQKNKCFSSDNNPQIKITNVTSIAKGHEGVIVISDDENDDVSATTTINSNATRVLIRAQKRPTTVSSVPSQASCTKSRRLSDTVSTHCTTRPYAASAPSALDSPRHECCCTSNNMCTLHREMLLRNRIVMDMRSAAMVDPSRHKPPHNNSAELSQSSHVPVESYQKSTAHHARLLEHQAALKMSPGQLQGAHIKELIHSGRANAKELLQSMQNPPVLELPPYTHHNAHPNCGGGGGGSGVVNDVHNSHGGMKAMLNSSSSSNNSTTTPYTVQHFPSDPTCQVPPDYLQQQWMNMIMLSSQRGFPSPDSLLRQPSQFAQGATGSPQKSALNSFINLPNAFYNC